MDVLVLVLWVAIGIINIVGAANGVEITIVDYILCWVVLLVNLTAKCFD